MGTSTSWKKLQSSALLSSSLLSLSYNCFFANSKERQRGFCLFKYWDIQDLSHSFGIDKQIPNWSNGICVFFFHLLSFTKSFDWTWGRYSLGSSSPRGWIETEPGRKNNHYVCSRIPNHMGVGMIWYFNSILSDIYIWARPCRPYGGFGLAYKKFNTPGGEPSGILGPSDISSSSAILSLRCSA